MSTTISPLAGKPAPLSLLVDVPKLLAAYFDLRPDPAVPAQRVAFGTSGHRGSSFERSFNEWHVLAIGQAICDYRKCKGIDGPLYLGIDTHALSQPALESALEVLAANGVETMIAPRGEYTPTPAISHAILVYNRGRTSGLAELDRRLRVATDEHGLDRDHLGPELIDHCRDSVKDCTQSPGHVAVTQLQLASRDQPTRIDDADAGDARTRVESENTHRQS